MKPFLVFILSFTKICVIISIKLLGKGHATPRGL